MTDDEERRRLEAFEEIAKNWLDAMEQAQAETGEAPPPQFIVAGIATETDRALPVTLIQGGRVIQRAEDTGTLSEASSLLVKEVLSPELEAAILAHIDAALYQQARKQVLKLAVTSWVAQETASALIGDVVTVDRVWLVVKTAVTVLRATGGHYPW